MLTRIHRAWLVAAVTFLVLIASAAFRSSVGLMIVPFEDDFGWSRSATSLAVSVNLVFYGLTAPFAAALMERFGVRRIAAGAMLAMRIYPGSNDLSKAILCDVNRWLMDEVCGTPAAVHSLSAS